MLAAVLTVAVLGRVEAHNDGVPAPIPAGLTTELLMRLALDAGVGSSVVTRTANNVNMVGGALRIGPLNFPQRTGGTGVLLTPFTIDFGNGNRAVLRRRTVHATASSTPTSDKFECYLRIANNDIGPLVPSFDVADVLAGAVVYFKVGVLSDGRTVTYQVAGENGEFLELTRRSYATADVASKVASWAFLMTRESGDLICKVRVAASFVLNLVSFGHYRIQQFGHHVIGQR